ncbi:MAG: NAD(P)/FAD-dependent oxidoreductase [Halofilum sp. (in: g-proteobacteria)]|nr:NAD(P)/FAD-dependent oxidoreductase [Halofilum sp. (in: g-proteobacteria)]
MAVVRERPQAAAGVAVVGAGPAGAAAVETLLAGGASVALFDEQSRTGGNVSRVAMTAPPTRLERLAAGSDRLELLSGASVRGVTPSGRVDFDRAGKPYARDFAAVILACGARDLHHPLPGLPHDRVSSVGALQALLKGQRIVPDGRVTIAGSGPFLYVAAAGLAAAGAGVTHVIDRLENGDYLRLAGWGLLMPGNALELARTRLRLRRHGTTVLSGRSPVAVHDDRLELDDATSVPFDRAGLTDLFVPQTELPRTAGCRLAYSHSGGYWRVDTDPEGRTSVAGVYACGEGQGIRGWRHAAVSGRMTAAAVLADTGLGARWYRRGDRLRQRLLARFGSELEAAQRRCEPEAPPAAAMICRCEGTRVAQVDAAVALGLQDLSSVKSVTRCGMGPCQGRYCEPLVARAIERAGASPREPLNQRAFVRPVTAGEIADGL